MPYQTNHLLTVSDVGAILTLGTSTIWRKVKEGSFPSPIKIGGATRWLSSDVEDYLTGLTREQRDPNAGGLLPTPTDVRPLETSQTPREIKNLQGRK